MPFRPTSISGSLLVAAAHYGAYVMGTDIDYLTVHAKGRRSQDIYTSRKVTSQFALQNS